MNHLANITTFCAAPGVAAEYIAECHYTLSPIGTLGPVTGTAHDWGFSRKAAIRRLIKKVESHHPNHTFIFVREDL